MAKQRNDLPAHGYKMLVQFWLDGKEMIKDKPSEKVASQGSFSLGPDGEKELRNTLAQFFGKVILLLVDQAEQLTLPNATKK